MSRKQGKRAYRKVGSVTIPLPDQKQVLNRITRMLESTPEVSKLIIGSLHLNSTYPWGTAHNWQKGNSRFLTWPCHEVYTVKAVGISLSNDTLKNYNFCENVKFGAIS